MGTCEWCGRPLELAATGRPRRFCSTRCRKAASRSPFPAAMITAPRWCRADGKRPIRPDGRPASSRDASTWSAFSDVRSGSGDGYGFMLGGGFGCYDLDHCSTDRALRFVASVRETVLWVERSVSGNGAHVFVVGVLEGPGRRGRAVDGLSVERYSWARFIRTTGHRLA